MGDYFHQEWTSPRDIYQKNLEQIPAEEKAKPGSTQASHNTSERANTYNMANTRTRLKPQLNYTILYRTEGKELAVKAIYLTLTFAHAFINTLLQHQWIKTIKGLPPKLYNWKQQKVYNGRSITA